MSMLLSLLPFTIIYFAIWPGINSIAIFFITFILTYITALTFIILINLVTLTMHHVFLPFTRIFSAVDPGVGTAPFHKIILPTTNIHRFISPPFIRSLPLFLTFYIVSSVTITAGGGLRTLAFLKIIGPHANFFQTSLFFIINAIPVRSVIFKLSLVYISVDIGKFTISIGHSVTVFAFILVSIPPKPYPFPMHNQLLYTIGLLTIIHLTTID